MLVTFDLFSALLDSRRGGAAALATLAADRGWSVSGEDLYDAWDPLNKAAQGRAAREAGGWVPWEQTAREAMTQVCSELGVQTDPAEAVTALVDSLPRWPLWPDVAAGLTALAGEAKVGLLSNVDDDLFRRTAAAPLVDHDVALTSQRLGAAKPDPEIYHRAVDRHGPLVHVATSARDVRGALEAGITVVRLVRPGHRLDPEGPTPPWSATSVDEVRTLLPRL